MPSKDELMALIRKGGDTLLQYRNVDGGWGVRLGKSSNPLGMPNPLRAITMIQRLTRDARYSDAIKKASSYVTESIPRISGLSYVPPMAAALDSLITIYEFNGDQILVDDASKTGDWLVENQNSDGSWGLKLRVRGKQEITWPNICLLGRLHKLSPEKRYTDSANRALSWIESKNTEKYRYYANICMYISTGNYDYLKRLESSDRRQNRSYSIYVLSGFRSEHFPQAKEAVEYIENRVKEIAENVKNQDFSFWKHFTFTKPKTVDYADSILYLAGYYRSKLQ